MREIKSQTIKEKIKELFKEVNIKADPELSNRLKKAEEIEVSETGKEILNQMVKNFEFASKNNIPICQDTGMAIVFLEIGQEVKIIGDYIEDAINQGVREAYEEAYLRKSVVTDPLKRINTADNTPAIIHTRVVPGDKIKLSVMAKGFGSENMSELRMLKPTATLKDVKQEIIDIILKALPNGCAPLVVGIGLGGDFELAALNAKKALLKPITEKNHDPFYRELEEEILNEANNSGIGPMGLGGIISVLAVHIIPYATHIAGLPLAVNICCYVDRTKEIMI